MVQTVRSLSLLAGEKTIIIEKPRVLHRVFFSIRVLAGQNAWYESKISFDDPTCCAYYILNGPYKLFEAKGDDIFQGDVWLFNNSTENLLYTATEILH